MLLTVMALGGTLLGATTVAGLLMLYQIRQSTDLQNSAKAIFAADAGLETSLYESQYGSLPGVFNPGFSNGASYNRYCSNASSTPLACSDINVQVIKSVGESGQVVRALQATF